jgi:hypothetical protein
VLSNSGELMVGGDVISAALSAGAEAGVSVGTVVGLSGGSATGATGGLVQAVWRSPDISAAARNPRRTVALKFIGSRFLLGASEPREQDPSIPVMGSKLPPCCHP